LISLFALILVLTSGLVFLFRRVRTVWRDLKSLGAAVDATAGELAAALQRLAGRSERFGAELPRLDAALQRLRGALARLAVLRAALRDVTDAWGRITALYPRK
jgi:hypothetical protein